ncbi:MAG TPA: hypothetical protein VKD67_09395 [Acidimicrobiales bacterium]|nr:hypothetical protein [Acidimicrobiales bacterium]
MVRRELDAEEQRRRTQAGRAEAACGFSDGPLPGPACPKCGRWLRESARSEGDAVYFECHRRCGYRRSMTRAALTARLLAAEGAGVRRAALD